MKTIRLDVADGIATLTLNQPAKRNPMSARMGEEIAEAVGGLERRDDARVLVLAGAGEAFCAGGDLALTYGTEDLTEGMAAGRERRAPRFTGR